MKKALLAILLLVIVAGVSYIKTARGRSESEAAYQKGKLESAQHVDNLNQKFDSLSYSYEREQIEAAQFALRQQVSARVAYDSVSERLGRLESEAESLKAQLRKEDASSDISSASRPILDYYRQRYTDLPKDLTAYERRVALREIRQETAQKFSLTLEQLEKIRLEHGLDY